MSDEVKVRALLEQVANDPQSAASRLFAQYAERLTAYARRRMSIPLRQKLDPEDIVQSALKSFFRHPPQTTLTSLRADDGIEVEDESQAARTDELWGLLVVITLRKCVKYIRLFGRSRRDLQREVSLSPADDSSRELLELIDRQPTPAEEAVLDDTLTQLGDGLTDSEKEMLRLRLEGATVDEIAVHCHTSKRTVERLLAKLRETLRAESDATASESQTSPPSRTPSAQGR